MSRISRIERLQRGHEPRFNHNSLEHTLQKVCPHGMNAAPFFLTMHTQHIESFPVAAAPSNVPAFSFSIVSSSPPSVSSNNLINDTLNGVPGAVPTVPKLTPFRSLGPTASLSCSFDEARNCLSAAKAAAKFIPEPDETGPTQSGSGLFSDGPWPTSTTSSSSSSLLSPTVVPPKTQVAPQQPIPLNLSRSFRLLRLLVVPSTPSICSLRKHRIVLVSLSLPTDSCNITPSWLIFTQTQKPKNHYKHT